MQVTLSVVEIYCERIRDLLSDDAAAESLTLQQDRARGMIIAGATEVIASLTLPAPLHITRKKHTVSVLVSIKGMLFLQGTQVLLCLHVSTAVVSSDLSPLQVMADLPHAVPSAFYGMSDFPRH